MRQELQRWHEATLAEGPLAAQGLVLRRLFDKHPRDVAHGRDVGGAYEIMPTFRYAYTDASGEEREGSAFFFRPKEADRKHMISGHIEPDEADPNGRLQQVEFDTEAGVLADLRDREREFTDEDRQLLVNVIVAAGQSLQERRSWRRTRKTAAVVLSVLAFGAADLASGMFSTETSPVDSNFPGALAPPSPPPPSEVAPPNTPSEETQPGPGNSVEKGPDPSGPYLGESGGGAPETPAQPPAPEVPQRPTPPPPPPQ